MVCAEINGQNSYGGYTGFKLYAGEGTGRSVDEIARVLGPKYGPDVKARYDNDCVENVLFILPLDD